jgi:hypothetical protein
MDSIEGQSDKSLDTLLHDTREDMLLYAGMLPVFFFRDADARHTARCTHLVRFSRNKLLGAKQSSHVLTWMLLWRDACRGLQMLIPHWCLSLGIELKGCGDRPDNRQVTVANNPLPEPFSSRCRCYRANRSRHVG